MQRKAHDLLVNYLQGEVNNLMALLVGYAGTGKSYLISKLVMTIKELLPGQSIAVCAPTHKAVKVLRKESLSGVSYATIHSLLGLKQQINQHTGEVSYIPDKSGDREPMITNVQILILDEVSMLEAAIYENRKVPSAGLVYWVKRGLRLIFVGDPAQIPPVNELDSIPLLKWKELGILKCELTEIMRQKNDNPILEFATEIRNDYKRGNFIPREHITAEDMGIEVVVNTQREEEILKQYFDCPQFQQDADHMKVIAWRNVTVDNYNRVIRSIIYKTDSSELPTVMPGEKLIMDKPVIVGGRVIIATNEEVEVTGLSLITKKVQVLNTAGERIEFPFQCYNTRLTFEDRKQPGSMMSYTMPIIHESALTAFNQLIVSLRKAALNASADIRGRMWRQYFQAMEQFAWVKYNYAITGHKSQGSSYDRALVLKWDIDYNHNIEERNRILYVACTRARHTLYIEP